MSDELQDAQKTTIMFRKYLDDLRSERGRLLAGALADPIAATRRLARIDAELASGKEVYQAASGQTEELRRRQAKATSLAA